MLYLKSYRDLDLHTISDIEMGPDETPEQLSR